MHPPWAVFVTTGGSTCLLSTNLYLFIRCLTWNQGGSSWSCSSDLESKRCRTFDYQCPHTSSVGLARTIYIHRIWPYTWLPPEVLYMHRTNMVLGNPTQAGVTAPILRQSSARNPHRIHFLLFTVLSWHAVCPCPFIFNAFQTRTIQSFSLLG